MHQIVRQLLVLAALNKVVNLMQFATLRFAVALPLYRKTPLRKPHRLQRR